MLLCNTTERLNIETTTAGSIDYSTYYVDHSNTTYTANSSHGNSLAIGTKILTNSPAAGTRRQIRTIEITNRDQTHTAQTVFIKKVVSGTDYYLTPNTRLGSGETLVYRESVGIEIRDSRGRPKSYTMMSAPRPAFSCTPPLGNPYSSARSIANTTLWLSYAGKAPRNGLTTLSVRYRVSVASVAMVAAEIGLYTSQGAGVLPSMSAGVPDLQVQCVGWTDFTSNSAAIGNYTATISVGSYPIKEGDDIWIGWYNIFLTTGVSIKTGMAEDLMPGWTAIQTTPERRPTQDLGFVVNLSTVGTLSVTPFSILFWS